MAYVSNFVYFPLLLTHINLDNGDRCRWISNSEEQLLYMKYDLNLLNVLDTQKGILTLDTQIFFEKAKDGNCKSFSSHFY